MSDDRFERALDEVSAHAPDTTIKDRIHALLVGTWPRWWSPFEVSFAVMARRGPRAMREMMEEDRRRPLAERQYEEKEVPNTSTGRGKHKVYRALVKQQAPRLFD